MSLVELTLRPASHADLDRLVEIHTSAFPDPRGDADRRHNFLNNPLGELSDLWVVEEGSRVVAHGFLFPLEVWIGGKPVRAGGIASVGVAPEARGRRLASRLLSHLHEVSLSRGDAMTTLYAFRQGFYARFGYAPVTPTRRLSFAPASVPRSWAAPPADLSVRAADGSDRDGIERAYLRAAARTTGWFTRSSRFWEDRLLDERRRWFVATRGAVHVGFLSWTVAQAHPHAETVLTVHDLVADDDDVRRVLLGLVGAQRDQVHRVELHTDVHDPIERALTDADARHFGSAEVEHALGTLAAGPLVRIADVTRALVARGYGCDGAVDVEAEGTRFRLEVHAGEASVGPTRAASLLTIEAPALSAIALGALSVSDAVRLGWAKAPDHGTLRSADALFALSPYFAIDAF